MTEPNKKLLADSRIPRITLGEIEWPVPKLSLGQNEVVVPMLAKHFADAGEKTDGNAILRSLTGESIHFLATVSFIALQRGHADITRDEFDDMPISYMDLVAAALVIAQQSGMFRSDRLTTNGVSGPLAVAATTSSPTG